MRENRKSRIGDRRPSTHRTYPAGAAKGNDGFTLLEILVAITILGLSLTVLLAIFSQTLSRVHYRDEVLQARALAQSLLAEARVSNDPDLLNQTGTTKDSFSWQVHTVPYGTGDAPRAAEVSVTVEPPRGSATAPFTLRTLRLVPRKPRT